MIGFRNGLLRKLIFKLMFLSLEFNNKVGFYFYIRTGMIKLVLISRLSIIVGINYAAHTSNGQPNFKIFEFKSGYYYY